MCRQLVGTRRPVLLGAARRHPARQGILPGVARCARPASTPRSPEGSRGACGVVSCSPTARSSRRSASGADRRRCGCPSPSSRSSCRRIASSAPPEPWRARLRPPSRARPPSPHTAGRGDGGALLPPVPHEPRSAAVKPRGARRPGPVPCLALGRLAQLARAPPLQGGCRGFESLNAHRRTAGQEDISRPGVVLGVLCRSGQVHGSRAVRVSGSRR